MIDVQNLGPLAAMAGIWEGQKGDDISLSDDRGTENNKYRERMTLEPIGAVNNHEQQLYGLRYARTAWRIGEDKPFHEDLGYWLWDARAKQVIRSFIIPRGVAVLAGGTVEPDSKSFKVTAEAGSDTYGICSNKFLDKEFKTVRYEIKITLHGDQTFTYEEDTQLKMPGRKDIFHHTDKNTLKKVDR